MGRPKSSRNKSPPVEATAESETLPPAVYGRKIEPAKDLAPKVNNLPYTLDTGERIAQLYATGYSLRRICEESEMPTYPNLMNWLLKEEGFRNLLRGARAVKAIHHEELAMEAAEAATGKEDTSAQRLKFDAHKWASEVNDPTVYGKKTTVSGDPDRPIQILVVTGVPDVEPARIVEAEVVKPVTQTAIHEEAVSPLREEGSA